MTFLDIATNYDNIRLAIIDMATYIASNPHFVQKTKNYVNYNRLAEIVFFNKSFLKRRNLKHGIFLNNR